LLVASDSFPKYLYRKKHDGTFEDVSYLSGFALNDEGREQAAMGIALGDYNRDGRVDIYITNFSDDYNTLYRNDGDTSFTDVSFAAGMANVTIPFLGWGTGFMDYDNDGLVDIFVANGHVYPGVDQQDWGTTWAQRPLLFRNINGTKFDEVAPASGSGLAVVVPARGAAFGDLFNDGHIDVVMNVVDSTPVLLRNAVKNTNHWLDVKLVGGAKSPCDAIGAKAWLTAGGVRQRGDVFSGGSYASSSDLRLHFGLGAASKVDRLEIQWPSGSKEEIRVPAADRIVTIVEGKGIVEP
jgi:enediyne biosynthesis protein E4